ncbi:zinc ABC transporter substrate-binding protein [Colidextribacter sp. OB.20]|nr:zinc ABC transporter substrate-binding protein [Colidextribacter sp. OB.20]
MEKTAIYWSNPNETARKLMKKTVLISILAALLLSLPGCGARAEEAPRLTVVCTTYPIYLLASALSEGVEGVAVERLDTGSVSCLHNYTLSMADMKKIERADVIAINGAGLEEFLEDALQTSDARVIDCSEGIELLESLSHRHEEGEADEHGHDHGHWDPHYWMDPNRALHMANNLVIGLVQADLEHSEEYGTGWSGIVEVLCRCSGQGKQALRELAPEIPGLITFHDGFQYFAEAFGLPLLAAIEEEAGSEASAKEIVEITRLVKEYGIPVIFTEVNGSDATAQAIARETGCQVVQLNMLMDGPEVDLETYYTGITGNLAAILNGFAGEEVISFDAEDQAWKANLGVRCDLLPEA